ncbi:GIY-YIG nuclease family protein [Aliivibrio fischeri]
MVFLTSNDLIEDDTYNEDYEDYEDYEDSVGKVYILKTGTFTSSGDEILKIGRTTQDIEKRINQLYTTDVPFQFEVYKVFEVNEHIELESAFINYLVNRMNK